MEMNEIEKLKIRLGYLVERVETLEEQMKLVIKTLNNFDTRIKDIDMDLNDIFDDVEGKHEDSDK